MEDASFIVNRHVNSFTELTDEEETLIREVLEAMADRVAGAPSVTPEGVENSGDGSPGSVAAPAAPLAAGVDVQGSAPAPARARRRDKWKVDQELVRDIRAAAAETGRYHAPTDFVRAGEWAGTPEALAADPGREIVTWMRDPANNEVPF